MEKRILGKTGYSITPVVYGGIVSMRDGQDASDRYVSWAIDRGVNYFDVAPSYGDAQEKLGNSLKPYRNSVYLACKTQKRTAEDAKREMLESMKLLHTDYFDVYQLHALSSREEVKTAFAPGGVMEAIEWGKREGIIRHTGITAHSEAAALAALELYDFDTVLYPMNWSLMMAFDNGKALLAKAKERGMGFLAMKAFIERAWNDQAEREGSRFPKSWCKPIDTEDRTFLLAAMRFTLELGVDTLVPSGNFETFSFAIEHIDEALAKPISEEEHALLADKLEGVRDKLFFTEEATKK
ncbi:MAG: aldo/keto reductase [Clostridiaceae bacterium]|nr:aldo/keto reductase [Clostridiaceae bacterium]